MHASHTRKVQHDIITGYTVSSWYQVQWFITCLEQQIEAAHALIGGNQMRVGVDSLCTANIIILYSIELPKFIYLHTIVLSGQEARKREHYGHLCQHLWHYTCGCTVLRHKERSIS